MSNVVDGVCRIRDWFESEPVHFAVTMPKSWRPFTKRLVLVELQVPGKDTWQTQRLEPADSVILSWPLEAHWDDTGELIGRNERAVGYVTYAKDGSSVSVFGVVA